MNVDLIWFLVSFLDTYTLEMSSSGSFGQSNGLHNGPSGQSNGLHNGPGMPGNGVPNLNPSRGTSPDPSDPDYDLLMMRKRMDIANKQINALQEIVDQNNVWHEGVQFRSGIILFKFTGNATFSTRHMLRHAEFITNKDEYSRFIAENSNIIREMRNSFEGKRTAYLLKYGRILE